METMFHLNNVPDKEFINDVSIETNIDSAFIEKDWYATQLLSLLAEHGKDKNVQLIFSGGTSLSKGHNLIQRFSEDLDFFLHEKGGKPLSQNQRRSFRKSTLEHITANNHFETNSADVQRGNSHRFFKAPIRYQNSFKQTSLREYLQLEMTFCSPRLPIEIRPIQSIISKTTGQNPETSIACISPLETAGDKLSALTWRVVTRNRNSEKDDPSLIRHLHDLAALKPLIDKNPDDFYNSTHCSFEYDQQKRGGHVIQKLSMSERIEKALHALKHDNLYKKEYEHFVTFMSYANENERIDFDQACSKLEEVISIITT